MNNKRKSIIVVAIFILFSLFNLLSPIRAFSPKENRYLQTFPDFNQKDIFSGKFGSSFETFLSDQFIERDTWTGIKTVSDLSLMKKDNGRVYFGKDNYLFEVKSEIDEKQFEKNMTRIHEFIERFSNDSGTSIYSLLVPSKESILIEELPLYAPIVDERKLMTEIDKSLSDDITMIDLFSVFEKIQKKQLYYRTDHHWTSAGSFLAYQTFIRQVGKVPFQEEDYQIKQVSDNFYGTLYRKANYYTGLPDEIFHYQPLSELSYQIKINGEVNSSSLYYPSFLEKTDQYSYFLGGNHALMEINSSNKNGKTLAIIKDSFANSLIPFLFAHYEKVIIIDPRHFGGTISDYLLDYKIDDMLFLFNIQDFVQGKSFNKLTN